MTAGSSTRRARAHLARGSATPPTQLACCCVGTMGLHPQRRCLLQAAEAIRLAVRELRRNLCARLRMDRSNRYARAEPPGYLANRDCFGRSRIARRRYFQRYRPFYWSLMLVYTRFGPETCPFREWHPDCSRSRGHNHGSKRFYDSEEAMQQSVARARGSDDQHDGGVSGIRTQKVERS